MKVLVITPVYNGEKFIRGAIESILQQDYPSELLHQVIIDDCSTDKTVEEIEKYLPSSKITLLKNKENRGTYYCRNRGLEFFEKNQDFDIVTNHDADDLADITRIKHIVNVFNIDSDVIGVVPRYMRVSKQDIDEGRELKGEVRRGEGTAFYSRFAFNNLGYFDNTRYSGDTEYWLRAEAYCKNNPPSKIAHFIDVTYIAINHGTNLTTVHPDRTDYINDIVKQIEDRKQTNDFFREKFN